MVIAFLPLLFAVVGAIIYAASTAAKPAELGRLAFWCGLLAFLLMSGRDLLVVHVQ